MATPGLLRALVELSTCETVDALLDAAFSLLGRELGVRGHLALWDGDDTHVTRGEPVSAGAAHRTWLEISGVDGMLRVNDLFRPSPRHDIYLRRGDGVRQVSVEGSPLLFVRQIEDLIAAALDGRPPAVSLQESRGNAAALAALYRSARDGQPVQL